jgi:hypothetical protein
MGVWEFDKADAFAVNESCGCSSVEAPCDAMACSRIANMENHEASRRRVQVKDALSVFYRRELVIFK